MATVAKGHMEQLPSGSFRVRVYAGTDPVTRRERRFRRTVKTEDEAAEELAKLLRAAEAERAPTDSATVGFLLELYLEVADLSASTRSTHDSYVSGSRSGPRAASFRSSPTPRTSTRLVPGAGSKPW